MKKIIKLGLYMSLIIVLSCTTEELDVLSLSSKNVNSDFMLKSASSGEVSLIDDATFQTGFTVLDPNTGNVEGSIQYTTAHGNPKWNLSQWYSTSSLFGAIPRQVSSGSYRYADANKAVTIGPATSTDGHLIFAINGLNEFNQMYRGATDPFPHLLADQRIAEPDGWLGASTPFIGEMSSLDFSVDALLQYHTRNQLPGYNPDIHALQFNCVFLVQNLKVGSRGYGKNMYFMSTIFDDRYLVPGLTIKEDLYSDRLIYDVGLIPFSDTGLTVGTWKTISGDILPHIKIGLQEAWNRGYLTESTSFNDYKVSLFTTGFECPGLNIGTMQVRNLSLIARKTIDYDGNTYHTTKIGNDEWMIENFRSTHFNDGRAITVNYHPDDTNQLYGPSYSWNDIVDPNFAPDGWHVATDAEWQALYNIVGGDGKKIKESGTNHWNTANGTNETEFTALGGAHIYGVSLKTEGTWWTATENNSLEGKRWSVFDNGAMWTGANNKSMYFPVRLVKDK